MQSLQDAYLRFVPPMVLRRFEQDASYPTAPLLTRFAGAVMFADVSGFTPLTEYLAHRGPDGAEQLTRILNDYFGQLVEIITKHGGEVAKFAGDAMVAVWPAREGSRHTLAIAAQLAVQSGLEAQQRLHNYQVLDGRLLSLHVGIGAGDVMAFHVGGHSGHWEFTLAGPALEQMADAEHLSLPGTVVLSPEAWSLVKQHCSGQRMESGFVQAEKTELTSPPTAPPLHLDATARPAIETYIPDAARAALAAGQTDWMAELRRITVLFINVAGLDYGAPDILDQLQRVTHSVQSILLHYEAAINQLLVDDKGTVIVAALGLPPLGHEDDAVRGVNAAVAIAARLRELELGSGIGVTTGRVFCGPVGSPIRSTYTIMGDTVNVAARLMQKGADDVLCDEATCALSRSRLSFDQLPPVQVKGKSEPIAVFRPHGETNLRQRLRRMFGRVRERKVLAEQLALLKAGTVSYTLLVEGDAGMGKSRLVAELQEQARGHDVICLLGAADAIEKTTPYLAFRSVFRQVFNLDPLTGVEEMREQVKAQTGAWFAGADRAWLRLIPLLNEVLSLDFPDTEHTAALSGRTRAENTQRLLVKLLQKAVATEHVVLILEDCHWLDSASWNLALRVSTEVQPILLVMAHRPLDAPPDEFRQLGEAAGTVRMRLEALSPEDTMALICERLEVASLPDAAAQFILKRGGGSPFFTEELAYALRDTRTLLIEDRDCRIAEGVESLETVQVPETLQGVITSRIDRLERTQQLMLKSASVIGRVFAFNILQDIFPLTEERAALPDKIEDMVHSRFVLLETPAPDLAYIFNHVITQEVAYQQMLFSQRRQLHRAVAEWYERHQAAMMDTCYPLLAHHWAMADDNAKTVEYLGKAGEQALRSGAYREACAFLEDAVKRECPDPLQRAWQERLLGEAHLGLGSPSEGRVHLERALSLLDMPRPGAAVTLLWETARQVAHRRWPQHFMNRKAADRARLLEAVRAYERLMEVNYVDEQQLPTMFSAIKGTNEAEEVGPSPELARLYANMCIAVGLVPLRGAAEAYAWRAQVVARQVKQMEVTGWVWQLIGMHALGIGQLTRAEEHLRRSSEVFERLGDARHWEESACLMAERFLYQGRMERCAEVYAKVLTAARQTGDAQGLLWCLTGRALSLTLMGREPGEAAALYREAGEVLGSRRYGQLEQVLYHGEMALFHVLRGDEEGARQSAQIALTMIWGKPPTALSSFEGRSALTEAALRLWELEKARGALALHGETPRTGLRTVESLERFARIFPIAQARACTWRGLADWLRGHRRPAFAAWRRALSCAERMDLIFDQALAHREIGRHLHPDHVDRAAHLERATELFTAASAHAYLD